MRNIDTSVISNTVGLPIKAGTLEHIFLNVKEAVQALLSPYVLNPVVDQIYIISGCENTGSGNTYNISSGWIYLNGEVFAVDAVSFTKTTTQIAGLTIDTTFYSNNADITQLTDGTVRTVHQIRKVKFEPKQPTGNIPFESAFRVGTWQKGDVKTVNCDINYYNNNFDSSGIGKNERLGWKVCDILKGRTLIGFDPATANTSMLGDQIGATTATLTQNNLPPFVIPQKVTDGSSNDGGTLAVNFDLNNNVNIGNSTPFSIVQPSTIILLIEKL